MRRRFTVFTMALLMLAALVLPALAAQPAKGAKAAKAAKPDAVPAVAAAPDGFNVEAFRKSFPAGLAARPNLPRLGPESVVVESAVKAAAFAGTDIYLVRGRLTAGAGQEQPFSMFVSADGQYYISDIIDMVAGKSILKHARDNASATDLGGLGHTVLKGGGTKAVTFVSDPFCPYCRTAFAFIMERSAVLSELRLAHYPLSSHPGADIACALMAWAADKAPDKALDFVRFAYTELPVPKAPERTEAQLKKAWNAVAGAYLARFPELKALGADADAIVAALVGSPWVKSVQEDMAKAAAMNIDGTPITFVGGQRVEGFDRQRLGDLLK